MRTTASRTDDWLSELFLDQLLNAPNLPVVRSPNLVRVDVIRKPDELERQFRTFSTGRHLVVDQVLDSELPIADLDRIIGWNLALR